MSLIPSHNLDAELAALDAKINAFLPPQYQHCYETVSPSSMGSAGLIYGPDGRVAWDQVWTTFCDLALAGGPPHRGKLLEPVLESEVAADPKRTREVVIETCRAIGLTTGFPVVLGWSPGWVGVKCKSVAEAAWLQFAVTAENVSSRRRRDVLELPVGPSFRVEKEIKNVVVALAKSYHYWDGHLTNVQQTLAGAEVWEAATPTEAAANPSGYEAAMSAMEDGLRPVGLPIAPRRETGWVGVEASSEEEAVWLLRAVLVEQVLVRREVHVLYFPVNLTTNHRQSDRVARAFAQAYQLRKAASPRGSDG